MNNDVSIVIPTHNRHEYLQRILRYYENKNIKIIIADSSKQKYIGYLHENFDYYHLPDNSYVEKLYFAYSKVNSKYTLMCADDDFIIPETILKCVEFLKQNNDYSSVHGRVVIAVNKNNKIRYYPVYLSDINRNINSDKPSERVIQLMSDYVPVYYSVHKTEHVREIFRKLNSEKYNYPGFIELLFSISILIFGKHKVLPYFYSVREYLPNSTGQTIEKLNVVINNPVFKNEFEKFKKTLSIYLTQNESISYEEAIKIIEKALDLYINKISYKSKYWLLEKLLPNFLIKPIKSYRKQQQREKSIEKVHGIPGYPFFDDIKSKSLLEEIHSIIITNKRQ